MRAQVLFSGGKDSSLCAVLLEPFYEVELVTCTFGVTESWRNAQESARAIGFPFKMIRLDQGIVEESAEVMLKFGYPRHGISLVHRRALETVAVPGEVVADGIRRDDRAPALTIQEVRSLEDRLGVKYVRPLAGYGRSAIDALVAERFEVVEGDTGAVAADYETEIREYFKMTRGAEEYARVFPPTHTQSRVLRRCSHDKKEQGQETKACQVH